MITVHTPILIEPDADLVIVIDVRRRLLLVLKQCELVSYACFKTLAKVIHPSRFVAFGGIADEDIVFIGCADIRHPYLQEAHKLIWLSEVFTFAGRKPEINSSHGNEAPRFV